MPTVLIRRSQPEQGKIVCPFVDRGSLTHKLLSNSLPDCRFHDSLVVPDDVKGFVRGSVSGRQGSRPPSTSTHVFRRIDQNTFGGTTITSQDPDSKEWTGKSQDVGGRTRGRPVQGSGGCPGFLLSTPTSQVYRWTECPVSLRLHWCPHVPVPFMSRTGSKHCRRRQGLFYS